MDYAAPTLANGETPCQTDMHTAQTAVDAIVHDNRGTLPSWLKSSPDGVNMAGSDFAAIVSNGYLRSEPDGCYSFTLITTTQNGVVAYVVKGQP